MKGATIAVLLLTTAAATHPLVAQHAHGKPPGPDSSHMIGAADAAMSGPMSEAARKHMQLSPTRRATREDSARAREVARQLRLTTTEPGLKSESSGPPSSVLSGLEHSGSSEV